MAEKQCLRVLGCEKIRILPVALQKSAGEKVIVFGVQVGVKPQRVYQQNHGKDRKEKLLHCASDKDIASVSASRRAVLSALL